MAWDPVAATAMADLDSVSRDAAIAREAARRNAARAVAEAAEEAAEAEQVALAAATGQAAAAARSEAQLRACVVGGGSDAHALALASPPSLAESGVADGVPSSAAVPQPRVLLLRAPTAPITPPAAATAAMGTPPSTHKRKAAGEPEADKENQHDDAFGLDGGQAELVASSAFEARLEAAAAAPAAYARAPGLLRRVIDWRPWKQRRRGDGPEPAAMSAPVPPSEAAMRAEVAGAEAEERRLEGVLQAALWG